MGRSEAHIYEAYLESVVVDSRRHYSLGRASFPGWCSSGERDARYGQKSYNIYNLFAQACGCISSRPGWVSESLESWLSVGTIPTLTSSATREGA